MSHEVTKTQSLENGDAGECEICGKPLRTGQVAQHWDDIGTAHFDCDAPYVIVAHQGKKPSRENGGSIFVILGDPSHYTPLSAVLFAMGVTTPPGFKYPDQATE